MPNGVKLWQYIVIMPWVAQGSNCTLTCHRMLLETLADKGYSLPPYKVSQGDGGSDEGQRPCTTHELGPAL